MPRPYNLLARYYDEIFGPFRDGVDVARRRIVHPMLPRIERACDLCCGTGGTAIEFARRGITTFGVDLSPAMCRATRKKADTAGLHVRVLRADMRAFRLPRPVDLITCEADALNHLARRAELAQVIRSVSRALRPGGHFYFDVNNLAGFERYWTGVLWVERPGVVLAMRNGNNLKARKAWSDIEWFLREGACWRRHSERVEEVCWDPAEIRRVLQKHGFDTILDWDAAPFFRRDSVIGPGCRTIYLARKAF